jgi:polysaccharide export outer membrane protein
MSRYLKLIPLVVLLVLPACLHLQNESEKDDVTVVDAPVQPDLQREDSTNNDIYSTSSDLQEIPVSSNNPAPEVVPQNNSVSSQIPDQEKDKTGKRAPYRLNLGDVIEISVLDEPEMTRDVTIIPDGTITYLLVGEMQAEGLTIAELRKKLTVALQEFFIAPYVSILTKEIKLPEKDEKRVSILGAMKNPGNYTWHEGDRILDLLAKAGGLLYTQTDIGSRATANLKASYLSRKGKAVDVDFFKLMQLGDMKYNILLQPDDFIYIADAGESTVIVMGEVNAPRIIPYTRDYSLVEALSICQGFTREAYKSRVIIIRTPPGEETKYVEVDVNDLLHGKDIKNLMLQSGDIVYVPEQTLSEYARWAGYLSDIADLILNIYRVKDAIRFPHLSRGGAGFP